LPAAILAIDAKQTNPEDQTTEAVAAKIAEERREILTTTEETVGETTDVEVVTGTTGEMTGEMIRGMIEEAIGIEEVIGIEVEIEGEIEIEEAIGAVIGTGVVIGAIGHIKERVNTTHCPWIKHLIVQERGI